MKFQYREIVRLANRKGLTFGSGYSGRRTSTAPCIVGVVGVGLVGDNWYMDTVRDKGATATRLANSLGVEPDKLKGLEAGYEGWIVRSDNTATFRRYHKIGKRLRKLREL